MTAAALLWGIGLGVAVAVFSSRFAFDRDRSFYPTVLIVIAAYYVIFAVISGSARAIWIEIGIAALFFIASIVGYRWSPLIVAAAIFAHGAYDAAHHFLFPDHGAPVWWPAFCGAIDGVLAIAAALAVRGRKKAA